MVCAAQEISPAETPRLSSAGAVVFCRRRDQTVARCGFAVLRGRGMVILLLVVGALAAIGAGMAAVLSPSPFAIATSYLGVALLPWIALLFRRIALPKGGCASRRIAPRAQP